VAGTIVMCIAQGWTLRRDLGSVEGARTLAAAVRMLAAAGGLGLAAYAAWYGLDALLGRALAAQAVAVLGGIGIGLGAYAAAVWLLGVPEARQIRTLLVRRGARPG
jgi:hypothetical protein